MTGQDDARDALAEMPGVMLKEQSVHHSNHAHDSWWWERPNGQGDLGYNRPDVLLRCQRIWGGRIKVIRQKTVTVTTVYDATPHNMPGQSRTKIREA